MSKKTSSGQVLSFWLSLSSLVEDRQNPSSDSRQSGKDSSPWPRSAKQGRQAKMTCNAALLMAVLVNAKLQFVKVFLRVCLTSTAFFRLIGAFDKKG